MLSHSVSELFGQFPLPTMKRYNRNWTHSSSKGNTAPVTQHKSVDLSKLSRYVHREQFLSPIPTPTEAVADIIASEALQVFTVLHVKLYHKCLMNEQNQLLATFLTSFGRFEYKQATYSLSSIAEHYNRWMAKAFDGLLEFCRVVNDIIIYDKDKALHINHVWQFLQQYKVRHITLNKGKCKFSCTGHICRAQAIFRRMPGWFNYDRGHHKISLI